MPSISRLPLAPTLAILLAAAPATQPARLANTSHQIASAADDTHLLRPRDASSKDGTPIVLYPRQAWRCLTWEFQPAPTPDHPDALRLVNHFTHKTLAPTSNDDNAPVTQSPAPKDPTDAQRWRFAPAGDNLYRIDHLPSGKSLSTTPDGTTVIKPWTSAPTQKWKLLDKPTRFTG